MHKNNLVEQNTKNVTISQILQIILIIVIKYFNPIT